MSYTDQAFIRAFQTDAPYTPVEATPAPTIRAHESHRHGPHAHFAGGKRPLSQAVQATDYEPQEVPVASEARIAGVTLARFSAPEVAVQLAAKCGDDYRRMMAYASRSGQVIGFLGAGAGVGCSTTTLAAALAVAVEGPPVAVIDAASGKHGLAESLGILNAPSLADVLAARGAACDALLHSIQDNISVGVAFSHAAGGERQVSSALRSLNSTHAAVMVDLGCDVESIATRPAQGADSLRLDAVVIVRQANCGEADVMFARRVLAASGQTVVGVIESFAS